MHTNKIKNLINLYSENKIFEGNVLFEEILREKLIFALQERKEEMNVFSEGDIKVNKRQKNKVAFRIGKGLGAGAGKLRRGREAMRSSTPEQLKTILATEGIVKRENKKHKGEVEARIGASLRKNHLGMSLGSSKKTEGRQAEKTLPSSVIKTHSKQSITPSWVTQIGYHRTPVTESNGDWTNSMLKHIRTQHPHLAHQRNLRTTILKYKKIDAVSRKNKRKPL